jgi:hypothetical protein
MFVFTNPNAETAYVTLTLYAGNPSIGDIYPITVLPGQAVTKSFGDSDDHSLWPCLLDPFKVENPDSGAGSVSDYGIHITSNVKILAYYMVNGFDRQRDIYSLKGKAALGAKFITTFRGGSELKHQLSYTPRGSDQIDIVATKPYTKITFTPTMDCISSSGTPAKYDKGTTYTTDFLQPGQTFKIKKITGANNAVSNYENEGTLSGTVITTDSDKPIAVTMSEDCITTGGGHDLAGDQIIPVDIAGSRYVIIRGYGNDPHERVDFTATEDNTEINVYYFVGTTSTLMTSRSMPINLNEGETDTVKLASGINEVFVQANHPVYCYQHTATGTEIGGAIIPSMYSISQHQISFYATNGTSNDIFLIYRMEKEPNHVSKDSFQIEVDNGGSQYFSTASTYISSNIPGEIPFPTGGTPPFPATDWGYLNVRFNSAVIGKVVTIRNNVTPFSLGYINAVNGTAGYGYLSAFSSFEFDLDTVWRCRSFPEHGCVYWDGSAYQSCDPTKRDSLRVNVLADTVTWTTPDGDIEEKPYKKYDLDYSEYSLEIPDTKSGQYKVRISQDGNVILDTIHVFTMTFGAEISRLPKKPAKVTVPQVFKADIRGLYDGRMLPKKVEYLWNADGGQIVSEDIENATVIWNSTGNKSLTLWLRASGIGMTGDTVRCDTTLTYCVEVHPKNLGFFVDQNVPYQNAHNGKSWSTAFPTLQQALALSSQGDYIWMADGDYSPRDSFYTDRANVYVGDYLSDCDVDSVEILTCSYVMDYDSVQVYGGFSGYGKRLCGRPQ